MKNRNVSIKLIYNTDSIMARTCASLVIILLVLTLAAVAGQAKKPLIDPFPLRFPLVEAGTLEIEGHIVGQPRARNGIVYFATREGFLTAGVAPAGGILWRFRADHAISSGPELGDGHIIIRDDGNTIYILEDQGKVVLKKSLDEPASSMIRESEGQLFFGTASGKILALDMATGETLAWEYPATQAITAGPAFGRDRVLFGTEDGRLLALDKGGRRAWEFAAKGKITVDPAVSRGRVYFGTEDRFFYCLDEATGKKKWSRRLQGAPLHPALAARPAAVVAASNSIIYFLSSRGGSILSWEAVPSRLVYELAFAGGLALVSSAAPAVVALDLKAMKRVGQYEASRPLVAGAVWSPPFVVLFEEDVESGLQRIVFLRSR